MQNLKVYIVAFLIDLLLKRRDEEEGSMTMHFYFQAIVSLHVFVSFLHSSTEEGEWTLACKMNLRKPDGTFRLSSNVQGGLKWSPFGCYCLSPAAHLCPLRLSQQQHEAAAEPDIQRIGLRSKKKGMKKEPKEGKLSSKHRRSKLSLLRGLTFRANLERPLVVPMKAVQGSVSC